MHYHPLVIALTAGVNFGGIKGILLLVGGLVVMVAGISISHKGKKGNFKQAAESGGSVLLGVLIFAIGAGFAFFSGAMGNMAHFFFGG